MMLDRNSGLLIGARQLPSPNVDDRPEGMNPEVLVIHAISLPPGEFGGPGVEQLFGNRLPVEAHPFYREIADLRVSAHFFVRRDGELVQFAPVYRRAWHAGHSFCEGRARVNDFSIGIELEGDDDHPFENAQYDTLAALTRALMAAYPAITRYRVYGHSDIAPGRKTDPGPHFDWPRYRGALPRPD
ncbi:MAG: 1,6-anhydro-N-acetylmuramyl-L-alanine amidase AmpD [Pseudomonadota bacterium]